MKIHFDFETYSECDIRKTGAWIYSMHPTTEVQCMAYAVDDQEPVLWLPDQPIPDWVTNPKAELHAWNSFFEYVIWTHVLKWPEVPIQRWHDTAAQAAALALPRSLAGCGEALNLSSDQKKNKRGSYLINKLCKPFRKKRFTDEELFKELCEYCVQDVVAEREIAKVLRPLSAEEREVWLLDQIINIRGVYVDLPNIKHATKLIDKITYELNEEIKEITDGELEDVTKRQRVLDYCSRLGYPLAKYDKKYLEERLANNGIPPTIKRIIQIRQQLGKTSTKKYESLETLTDPNNRVHGLLMYHGASTGRWAGKHFQPQNLPRPSFSDIDTCINLFKMEDPEILSLLYDDPMEALSSCVRGMITTPPGKILMVADYSAIEARVLAWLAGQDDVTQVFRGHGKIYEHTASQIYNKDMDDISKDERFVGKVATLALGYQGGKIAFQSMAKNYSVQIDEEMATRVVTDWRSANKQITSLWKHIEQAAIATVKNPCKPQEYRGIRFSCHSGFLFCQLPSKRQIAYYDPEIGEGMYGNQQVTYMGVNGVTRKWERTATYGGSLVQSIVQAVARDLLAFAMLNIEKAGYEIVLTVHDEIIAEVDKSTGSVEEFEVLMEKLPEWAEGLPLKAEGYSCARYQKG
jgi:DNA polymerase